jgi:hypothetical protein
MAPPLAFLIVNVNIWPRLPFVGVLMVNAVVFVTVIVKQSLDVASGVIEALYGMSMLVNPSVAPESFVIDAPAVPLTMLDFW